MALGGAPSWPSGEPSHSSQLSRPQGRRRAPLPAGTRSVLKRRLGGAGSSQSERAAAAGRRGGGAWSCRGPAEHRSAGSRRHGERGAGRPLRRGGQRGGGAEAGGAPGSTGARRTPTGSPGCAGAASSAGRRAEGCGISGLPGDGSCSPLPTDPSSLSSSILSSSGLFSLPPLRLWFCEWIRWRTTVRGTRLAGVSPFSMPSRGFAPVLAPRRVAPRFLRVNWAAVAGICWPGLPFSRRLGEARRKEPPPRAQVSIPPRVAPQQGTPVSWRGCRLGSPAKFRG